MYVGIAVLAVSFAVIETAPLSGTDESKLDQLIRLLTELKEKKVQAREEQVTTWDTHIISSTYSVGETKATELYRDYGDILDDDRKPVWNAHVLMTKKGRDGILVQSKFMEKDAFKKVLDDLVEKETITKTMRDSATVYMDASKATKFSGLVRILYKPEHTLLGISTM